MANVVSIEDYKPARAFVAPRAGRKAQRAVSDGF